MGSVFIPPTFKKIIKFRAIADGLTIQNTHTFVGTRALESEKDTIFYEQLHTKRVTCVAVCKHGEFLATGNYSEN